MILLDTSALIFWTLNQKRLTHNASVAIATANQLIISTISIWEIGIKVKKGKLAIPTTIKNFAQMLEKVDRVDFKPVDVDIWLENLALAWRHQDPADRTIVATAKILDCPLVTSDQLIRDYYAKAIW